MLQELKWIAEAGSRPACPRRSRPGPEAASVSAWFLAAGLPLLAAAGALSCARRAAAADGAAHPLRGRPLPKVPRAFDYPPPLARRPQPRVPRHGRRGDLRLGAAPRLPRGASAARNRGHSATSSGRATAASWRSCVKGRLQRLALSGGPALTICEQERPAVWGIGAADGTILLSSSSDGSIYQVSGRPEAHPVSVTTVASGIARDASSIRPSCPTADTSLYLARRNPRRQERPLPGFVGLAGEAPAGVRRIPGLLRGARLPPLCPRNDPDGPAFRRAGPSSSRRARSRGLRRDGGLRCVLGVLLGRREWHAGLPQRSESSGSAHLARSRGSGAGHRRSPGFLLRPGPLPRRDPRTGGQTRLPACWTRAVSW